MSVQLRLIYNGNGTFRVREHLDFKICQEQFGAGEVLHAKVTHQRSLKQNDYFHALIQAAWENQRSGPHLPTWEHLKHWLLIQADHCDVFELEPSSMTPQVAAIFRKTFDTVDFTEKGGRIFMKVAKSVSFKKCDGEAMKQVVDRVVAIICEEIVPGARPQDIFEMAKTKAA